LRRDLIGLGFAHFEFAFIQPCAQHVPGGGAVLVLRALGLTGDDDAGRKMGDADRRVGRIDMLTARARRSIRIYTTIGFIDVHLDPVVDHRIDPDRGEARMAAGVGVERRNPHQAMHAGLGLRPAMGVVAFDEQRARLDAGLFARRLLDHLDVEFVPLAPAHHAKQHARPILAFGAAGAGMNLDEGVVGVASPENSASVWRARTILRMAFSDSTPSFSVAVALGLAKLDKRQRVFELALEA
jgi:hypothetical protein